jgi:hypothetical protein
VVRYQTRPGMTGACCEVSIELCLLFDRR